MADKKAKPVAVVDDDDDEDDEEAETARLKVWRISDVKLLMLPFCLGLSWPQKYFLSYFFKEM